MSGSKTDGPCMFLLTLVQILGQIKDATWLQQTDCSSDQPYFLFSASSTLGSFLRFHLSSLLSRKYRPFHFLLSPFFIMSHFRSLFLFQTDPSLSPNPSQSFPYPYHTFTTCQEDSGLCGFCPALGEVQLRLRWAGCRFGLRSRPGPTVRK